MAKKFPYEDELLRHAEVASIAERQKQKFDSVKYFVK